MRYTYRQSGARSVKLKSNSMYVATTSKILYSDSILMPNRVFHHTLMISSKVSILKAQQMAWCPSHALLIYS